MFQSSGRFAFSLKNTSSAIVRSTNSTVCQAILSVELADRKITDEVFFKLKAKRSEY